MKEYDEWSLLYIHYASCVSINTCGMYLMRSRPFQKIICIWIVRKICDAAMIPPNYDIFYVMYWYCRWIKTGMTQWINTQKDVISEHLHITYLSIIMNRIVDFWTFFFFFVNLYLFWMVDKWIHGFVLYLVWSIEIWILTVIFFRMF